MKDSIKTIEEQIISLRKEGLIQREISNVLSITKDKVRSVLNKHGLKNYKYKRECMCCGKEYETIRHSNKFCNDKCRNKYFKKSNKEEKICSRCGKTFTSYRAKYCSDECRKLPKELKKPKLEYIPKPKKIKVCINCNKEYKTKSDNSKYCSYECSYEYKVKLKTVYNIKCKECGKWFSSTNKSKVFCSKRCGRKFGDRKKETVRRKRVTNNGRIDWDISIERLLKRDGHSCYLCGGTVNTQVDTNDDYYPSIEHIVPIAKGGTHTWDNVKLAHRICNSFKSDEIYDEKVNNNKQLALF